MISLRWFLYIDLADPSVVHGPHFEKRVLLKGRKIRKKN